MRSADPVSISAPVNIGEPTIEKFLTIPAAARALGAPPTKVRRAVKCGHFPIYRVGDKRALLRFSEVVAIVENMGKAAN
jgi:excisionase family DNA binding protein